MTEHYLDRLARTINENWDQPALTDFYLTEDGTRQDTSRGNHYTYSEMYGEILHVCDIFHAIGLQKGDHIAICGSNSSHWVIAYLAIAAYQGVAVTVLHSQSPYDIAYQIDLSDAKALFTDVDLWGDLNNRSLPQIEHIISLADWSILHGKKIPIITHQLSISNCQFFHSNPDELAMICFTSGSTGVSKGVMLPYKSINANVDAKYNDFIKSKGHVVLSVLPMGHVYGLMAEVIQTLCLGIHVVVYRGLLSGDLYVKLIHASKPDIVMTIPVLLETFINKIKTFTNDIGIIRTQLLNLYGKKMDLIGIGGSLLSHEMETILYSPEVPLGMSYGMTECGPRIALALAHELRPHTVGKILPTLTARISDNGEILVKGENVMLGYYKDPEATARKIDADGWLHTGDKGHLDEDGYLYVEGRLEQDMIVLPNGENIHPEDIERKINALPEASESIVLAREGKLVAIVVSTMEERGKWKVEGDALRRHILRTINPELPLYSQLYDVEITSTPLQKTEKQTIKRYLYK